MASLNHLLATRHPALLSHVRHSPGSVEYGTLRVMEILPDAKMNNGKVVLKVAFPMAKQMR